jgi:general secretion pathway protein F
MKFIVKAVGPGGRILRLVLGAPDAEDAAAQVRSRGNRVLDVRRALPWLPSLPSRRARLPLAPFCEELVALLESGMALVEALDTLADKEERPETRRVLERIVECLREGYPLSTSLERAGDAVPPLFVETVRAGEHAGTLAQALGRFARYQNQLEAVRRHVAGVLVYPAVLAAIGALVAVFLLMVVLPRLGQVLVEAGSDLPLVSRILLAWGRLLAGHALLAGAAGAAIVLLCAWGLQLGATRRWLAQRVWRVPAFGARLRVFYLGRLYRSLGMLLAGGMPVAQAMDLAGGVLDVRMRGQLADAANAIREGRQLSQALHEHGLAPAVAQRMLLVGERSGAMVETIERVASFYEDDTSRWVDRFTRLFEPLLMVAVGAVIGLLVLLMYMPIFDLAGSLG